MACPVLSSRVLSIVPLVALAVPVCWTPLAVVVALLLLVVVLAVVSCTEGRFVDERSRAVTRYAATVPVRAAPTMTAFFQSGSETHAARTPLLPWEAASLPSGNGAVGGRGG